MLTVRTDTRAIQVHGGIHGSGGIEDLILRSALPMQGRVTAGKP